MHALQVSITTPEEGKGCYTSSPHGIDAIELCILRQQRFESIRKVASGGELSRLMLWY